MFDIQIRSSFGPYQVQSINYFVERDADIYVVDHNVSGAIATLNINSKMIVEIEASEELKTLAGVGSLIETLAKIGANRNSRLVAIGGGTIQDTVTLAASIYMRGIEWIYIPTSLMAMTDSCVGGKSSINLGKYKNIIGNFYPPKAIYIDTRFSNTLNQTGVSSGLCEAIKICIARGPNYFEQFIEAESAWRTTRDETTLESLIALSLSSKAWFIEIDEFDARERKLLNYGHTFAHALEAATGMKIPHGLAVGFGMLCANSLVERTMYSHKIDNAVLNLLRWSGFNFDEMNIDPIVLSKSLYMDKKNSTTLQRLILLNKSDELFISENELNEEAIQTQMQVVLEVQKWIGSE